MRVKSAAKAYEESGQKLDLRTCFNIYHKVSSETEVNWKQSIEDYREFKKIILPRVIKNFF